MDEQKITILLTLTRQVAPDPGLRHPIDFADGLPIPSGSVTVPDFMRVLIAEDEKKLCRFLRNALREGGYAVDVVHDGPAALERALTVAYDVIILDSPNVWDLSLLGWSYLPGGVADGTGCPSGRA